MKMISLLPPEVRAKQRSRNIFRTYILGSGLVVLVFLFCFAFLLYMTNLEKTQIGRLKDQRADFAQRIEVYQEYGDLKERLDFLEKIASDAEGVSPNWYYTLAEVGSHLPDDVWLTGYSASFHAGKKEAKEEKKVTEAQKGELSIRGKAFSHDDVAALLRSLQQVKGLEDIRCQFSSEEMLGDRKLYGFEVKASFVTVKEVD